MHEISVDGARCQGHARCVVFAPDVFDFDAEGYAFVPEERSRVSELTGEIQKAVAGCPERAIVVMDTGGAV
jgi:ferredoxin